MRKTPLDRLLLFATLCVASFPFPASAYDVVEVPEAAVLRGTVRYLGSAPPPAELEVTRDAQYCGRFPQHDESLLVSPSKGLANVIVFVRQPAAGLAPTPASGLLDNAHCHYVPHVMALAVGSKLQVRNSDPILHNTHARLPGRDVFNYALPREGQVVGRVLDTPGLMKVGCDAGHTWMSAYVAVFDHPYFAVTDAEGRFEIPGLPPGSYSVVFWHEKLGSATQQLTVAAGPTRVDHDFR